jgi:ComF family protein
MKIWLKSLLHICFPVNCVSCGTAVPKASKPLCVLCLYSLPLFEEHSLTHNSVAKSFWGRVQLQWATCYLQMAKKSSTRLLLHQLKYKGNKQIGLYMGERFAKNLTINHPTIKIDIIIPLPLHPKKKIKRGYNQCTYLALGMQKILKCELDENTLIRTVYETSQTEKNRLNRWENVKDSFSCINPNKLANKKVLVLDDVITTGATLEACISTITDIPGIEISVAALAYAP